MNKVLETILGVLIWIILLGMFLVLGAAVCSGCAQVKQEKPQLLGPLHQCFEDLSVRGAYYSLSAQASYVQCFGPHGYSDTRNACESATLYAFCPEIFYELKQQGVLNNDHHRRF